MVREGRGRFLFEEVERAGVGSPLSSEIVCFGQNYLPAYFVLHFFGLEHGVTLAEQLGTCISVIELCSRCQYFFNVRCSHSPLIHIDNLHK